jgi:hypothetical protein
MNPGLAGAIAPLNEQTCFPPGRRTVSSFSLRRFRFFPGGDQAELTYGQAVTQS